MAFQHIRHKLNYLSEHGSTLILSRLSQTINSVTATSRQNSLLPPGMWHALELDLVYCLIRHRYWLTVPIFKDIVVDYLIRDFRLERTIAEALVRASMAALTEMMPRKTLHVALCDKEFLRYVFIATATAKSESFLVTELGFGDHLLKRIRQSVANLMNQQHESKDPETAAAFVPEMDALFSIIMIELSKELREKSWASDYYRLSYQVLGIAEPWRTLLAEEGIDWLFDILLAIGHELTLSTKQIAELIAPRLPGLSEDLLYENTFGLLNALSSFDLVTTELSQEANHNQKWRLHPNAYDFTAEAFATSFVELKLFNPKTFVRLNADYQAAIIRILPESYSSTLENLLKGEPKPLSPRGVEQALIRLISWNGESQGLNIIEWLLKNDPSPFRRIAACNRLASIKSQGEMTERLLAQTASDDSSLAVREIAAKLQVNNLVQVS